MWPQGRFALLHRAQAWGARFHFDAELPDGRFADLRPSGGIRITELAGFLGEKRATVLYAVDPRTNGLVAERLRRTLAVVRTYDPVTWNCETFARNVLEDRPLSSAVRAAFLVVAGLAILAA